MKGFILFASLGLDMQPSRLAPASFLKHAQEVASSYGFKSLREVEQTLALEKKSKSGSYTFESATALSLQAAAAQKSAEPVLAYWSSASSAHLPKAIEQQKPEGGVGEFSLQIAGVESAVAEVVVLKAIATIVEEWGAPLLRVRLNALGDKDSRARFEREAAAYVRKHQAHVGAECQEHSQKDPLVVYTCQSELCRSIAESGPRAMSFLSEKSRAHFKEVLEHLEKLTLPYEFDDLLLGDSREQRIVFAFDLKAGDATVLGAHGGRFDDYFRKLSPRREIGGASASIYFRKKGLSASHFAQTKRGATPGVYFIQLGVRAKLEGLQVSDVLRRARVPVLQSFDSSRLSHQLTQAKDAGVSHLIIMGEREALDRTVLVRSLSDNSQDIVPLLELPRFLKSLK